MCNGSHWSGLYRVYVLFPYFHIQTHIQKILMKIQVTDPKRRLHFIFILFLFYFPFILRAFITESTWF